MNNKLLVVLGIVLTMVVLGFVTFEKYVNTFDIDVQYMSDIKRLNEGSRSELSNYTKKIKEQVQIPAMYSAELQKVIGTYFESKGDRSNQKSVVAFMQEKVPNMDSSMYKTLMVTIDAGRDSFNNIQKRKVDICQNHEAFRKKFWTTKILGEFNPSDEYKVLCRVVSDSRTNAAFESGEEEALEFK